MAAVGLKRFSLASCHSCKKSRFPLLLLLRYVIETWVSLTEFPLPSSQQMENSPVKSRLRKNNDVVLPIIMQSCWAHCCFCIQISQTNPQILDVLRKDFVVLYPPPSLISQTSVFYIPALISCTFLCNIPLWLCYCICVCERVCVCVCVRTFTCVCKSCFVPFS